MKRPGFGQVIVGWLCLAGAAFFALFEHGSTDDYAGWVLAIVGLQIPAFFAFPRRVVGGTGEGGEGGGSAEAGRPLSAGLRWALSLPAALAAGEGAFWAAGAIGSCLWTPTLGELRPILMAVGAGIAGIVGGSIGFARVLRQTPHPRGVRRVLFAVTAIGAAGVAAPLLLVARLHGIIDEPVVWLAIGAPVLWAIPLWILAAMAPRTEPRIPRVVVR